MKELSLPNYARLLKSLLLLLFNIIAVASYCGIVYNGSPGTGAPPPTLGGRPVFPFPVDNRAELSPVTSVLVSDECPLSIRFSTTTELRRVPTTWGTWSHGYTGEVYSSLLDSFSIYLPPNTRAFYFYVEGNAFFTATVTATANDGTTSGPISVSGFGGARYFGFYTTNSSCLLTSIHVEVPGALGFAVGEFGINIDANNGAFACNNKIQISLDQNCRATIFPDMVLEGGGNVSCPGDYTVVVRDWITNQIIDIDPIAHYPQIGRAQIGRKLRISVIDPFTGNSCWGAADVEDKLAPILDCPPDIEISCLDPTDPIYTGVPGVIEACGPYTLTYKDVIQKGSCGLGYEKIIIRTWTAVDSSGNKSICVQRIDVLFASISAIQFPPHFDGLPIAGHREVLSCDEKYDPNKNVSQHILPSPRCVDDYLLDQDRFIVTGRRYPRTLGWNCIPSGPNAGHPSPDGIYYAANGSCWGANEVLMWFGTGRPNVSGCSNIAVTYKDLKISISKPGCDAGPVGCYKLLRTWTVLDWCTGQVKDSNQIIKVMDTEGPEVLYPDSLVVETDVWRCEGRWDVSRAWVTDNCSNDIHYTVRVEHGTVLGSQTAGYVVVNLPLGIQNAYIVAEDCCGNITEKLVILDVQDNTPPTAVCDQKTTVTINGIQGPNDNTAKILAPTFDDGSFDNCAKHIYFRVIRMDELLGTNNGSTKDNKNFCAGTNGDDDPIERGNQIYFDDHVKFCCDDVNKTVMVVFRVFDRDPGSGPVHPRRMAQGGDLYRHFSDCMVEVEVQDKSVPTVVAPPDIVVSCEFWIETNRLTDPNDATFGRVVNNVALRSKVFTRDIVCAAYCEENRITGYPGFVAGLPAHLQPAPNVACNYFRTLYNPAHPDNKYELVWGFDGYVISSCGVTPTISIRDLRECGQGRILRDVSARGPNGVVVRATQTIWVVNCDPFWIDRNNPCSNEDDIIWPDCSGIGTVVNGCGADVTPDRLGRPRVLRNINDHCSLIAIEPFDEVFTIEPDACFKILRRWVVIDWCQYNPNLDRYKGRWEHVQIIKVRDVVPPTVRCNVGPCEPAVINSRLGVCVGHIELTATAMDTCTPEDWLYFEYKIDAYNNGSYDYSVGRLTRKEYNSGILPQVRNNPFADNPSNPFNASGTYPIGTHRIRWFVEDGCGNTGTCETLFQIKDCKAPTPICLPGIITVPMPANGCVDIWAKDLDAKSFDNCTPSNRLKFYFNGDPARTFLRVCCDDFVREKKNDQLIVDVQVWVEDEEGNRDYCSTSVIVQDNQNICPNVGPATGHVSGLLKTETGQATAEASVELYNGGVRERNMTTSKDGLYAFYDLALNQNYMIKASRDGDYLNGVSTADIVRIQRHILNVETLDSPYKLLAADVNRSGTITARDMAEIRKLILGHAIKYENSPSWLILPENYKFTNPRDPFSYNSDLVIYTDTNMPRMDFIAVKVGDVNNSVVANAGSIVKMRSSKTFELVIEEAKLSKGSSVSVPIYSKKPMAISGFQFTLNFSSEALAFEGFQSGSVVLNDANFGTGKVSEGYLMMSWNAEKTLACEPEKPLFTLIFDVKESVALSHALGITSDVIAAEAYDMDVQPANVVLNVRRDRSIEESHVFELYQNNPNPFDQSTVIQFALPEDAPAILSIYDLTGKVVFVKELEGMKGTNQVKIDRNDLPKVGMYYYQLDAKQYSSTKRMVVFE